MLDTTLAPKEAVYLLADHLDAALAAGEDLLASRLDALADLEPIDDGGEHALAQFVSRLERLEASFMGRVLHARRRLDELPRHDIELKPVSALFFSSTGLLVDLIGHFKQSPQQQFDVGGDQIPFLRERGLLARDAAGLPQYTAVVVTEAYRIGGVIELGPLMDMVAGLLDLLDRRYDLYSDGAAGEAAFDVDGFDDRRSQHSDEATLGGWVSDSGAGSADRAGARTADDVLSGRIRSLGRRQRPALPPTGPETHTGGAPPVTASSLMEALRDIEKPASDPASPGSTSH